jgi:hypothetical protein
MRPNDRRYVRSQDVIRRKSMRRQGLQFGNALWGMRVNNSNAFKRTNTLR